MRFGEVIDAMKTDPSRRFARVGWNGKGMFVYLVPEHDIPIEMWRGEDPPSIMTEESPDGTVRSFVRINGHVDMKTADGSIICGWLATQTDMLKEDWYEVVE